MSTSFDHNSLRNQDKRVTLIRVDEEGALEISYEFIETFHKMDIIVQTSVGHVSVLNGKAKYQTMHLIISQELFYSTQVTRKSFGASCIIMPYVSPTEMITVCAGMLHTSYGMEQDLHTNT